ncbi:acyl transferase domain-containing protein/acyl carrier protein [Catenulispora sp. GAS73]|uniref:SDR family NAD(P)-dependent oxidoreductase n=1 Tax=Catenulispora sp. GAS73 TaxID=3156269 RepID=UPI0035131EDD
MTVSTIDDMLAEDGHYATAVALVGMSGRFPGADSTDMLWRNLRDGVKGLRELTDDELRAAGATPGQLADPRYVRIGGPLSGLDMFDATVFGINPREAEAMDPQHRLFLECTWEALEGAGYCPTEAPGQVAVFAGCGFPDYIVQNLQHLQTEPGGVLLIATGNERDSLANFVSYKLGLRGPAVTVQTFCSTSMIAIHLACQSLLTYECDLALAGGAFIPLPQPSGYLYEQGGISSPDGVVRSFDTAANGTVMGSGVGAVALKRMSEAVADGDVIHAVILGSAANNDGRVRAGYTAPGVDGQAEVIKLAQGVAGVKTDTIGYVECHATGTVLGDSIELAAMARVFTSARTTPCVLGTLKPSLGHLDRASGVAALIRAAQVVKNGVLPGTPNYQNPNPALATAADQFTVLTQDAAWPQGPYPRRAGVSSFGLGGTNAHVVLEEPPAREARPARPGPHLLTFSALNENALTEVTERLRTYLEAHEDADLADIAFTLQVSRGGFALRRAVVCDDRHDALAALADSARWIDEKTRRRNPKVRLVAGAEAPDEWWPQVHAAIAETGVLQPSGAAADGGAERVMEELGDWLTALGVRVVADAGADGVEEIVIGPDPDAHPDPDRAGAPASARQWLLATVARLWEAGSQINWPGLHGGLGRRVELPTYPFQRRRYWVDALPAAATTRTTGRTYDRSQWTYLPTWNRRPASPAGLDEKLREAGPWLVFTADYRGEALVERLAAAGADVTAVSPGEDFTQDPAGFTVRLDVPEDMARVLSALPNPPRAVVHGFSLGSTRADGDLMAHFDAEQDRGFYSVLGLARGLIDETGAAPRAEVILLTSGACGVIGSDLLHPEHSTLAALAPSLAQENPRVRSRNIDIDDVSSLNAMLAAAVGPYEGPVAVRAGEAWLQVYEPCPTDEIGPENQSIAQGDTVLITGGLGDVGLVLSRHLADKYGCKLVLTARTTVPPREEWEAFLEEVPEGGERTARHIRNIQDLEARGAEVLAMSADVADVQQMRAVVEAAVERFGKIDVVLHGAGVQDPRYFDYAHLIERPACEAHMAAKVKGFQVLQEVLGDQCPDRRITMSSVATVLGGMTLGAYAAANAALDAYLRLARRDGVGGRWITVDWDTWSIDPDRLATHGPGVTDYAMAPAEACDVFERTLAAGDRLGHLVISTGSLDHRIEQWVTGDLHDADDDDDRELHPRPDLNTPYVAPREGTEKTLADIWSKVLGIESIGSADNFFELGGHSLIAINLTTRIRKNLGAAIPITGLLESPTIGQLAALIDGAGHAASA